MKNEAELAGALVSADNIERAAHELRDVAIHTPLLAAPWLSEILAADVHLKCENLQRAGAFKIRGAYTAIARLSAEERARGVITYSSGNHAQGVALAARIFGVRAVVVMPTTSPEVKQAGARRLGAEVVLEGTTSTERKERAEAIAAAENLAMIPAFDHPDVIAGQGTTAIEILLDCPDVQIIVVPVGGGGLISGVAAYVKQTRPDVHVIGVEPTTANAMQRSLVVGKPVTIPISRTIADGLMPVRPGDLTYAHAQAFVDEIVLVDDDAILDATRSLIANSKLVVEFSGAATVAALMSRRIDVHGQRVVAILSGGNLDPRRAIELIA
jgi:threonine ammonia-lyase medium form